MRKRKKPLESTYEISPPQAMETTETFQGGLGGFSERASTFFVLFCQYGLTREDFKLKVKIGTCTRSEEDRVREPAIGVEFDDNGKTVIFTASEARKIVNFIKHGRPKEADDHLDQSYINGIVASIEMGIVEAEQGMTGTIH